MDNRLALLPEEILEVIVEGLKDSNDVLNLFKAYPEVGATLQNKKGAWLFDKAVSCLLPWLKQNEILACRQTCKRWYRAIDPVHPIPLLEAQTNQVKGKIEWLGGLEYEDETGEIDRQYRQTLAKMVALPKEEEEEGKSLNSHEWPKQLNLDFISKTSSKWTGLKPEELCKNTVILTFHDPDASKSLARSLNSEDWGGLIQFHRRDQALGWIHTTIKLKHNPEENTFHGFVHEVRDYEKIVREKLEALKILARESDGEGIELENAKEDLVQFVTDGILNIRNEDL